MPRRAVVIVLIALLALFSLGVLSVRPAFTETAKAPSLEEMRLLYEQTKSEAQWAKTVTNTALTVTGIILGIVALFSLGFTWVFTRRIRDYTEEAKEFRDRTEGYMKEASKVIAEMESRKEAIDETISEHVEQAVEEIEERRDRATEFSRHMMNGIMALAQFQDEAALECFSKALEIDDESRDAWITKGAALAKLWRYPESLEAYEKALEIDPNSAIAWSGKGLALSEAGRHEEALSACEKAFDLETHNDTVWTIVGESYRRMGRYDEALKAQERAIELNPYSAVIWSNKGAVLRKMGHFDEAFKAQEKAIELDPNFPVVWLSKACTHAQLRQKPEMLSALKRAVELMPRLREWAKTDPDGDFEPYRDDPDFRALVYGEEQ